MKAIAETFKWLNSTGWILQVFIVVLVTAVINYIERRTYSRLYPKLQRTRILWDDAFLYAIHQPLGWLIWAFGLLWAIEIIEQQTQQPFFFKVIEPGRDVILIGLLVWALIRFIGQLEQRWVQRSKHKEDRLDKTTIHAMGQLLRTAVLITAALITLQTLGINISAALAFGGIGAFAIGLAAKDMLANYFGGLMIYLSRPFNVGDWIRSPDKNIEGTVEHIGWRLTRILSFDKRPIYVPNALFSTIVVVNPSRMTNRRIYTNVGLRYEDANKMAGVLQDIEKMLRAHPEIDQDKTLMVNLVEFGSSSLNFMIYTFTKTTNWVKFQAVQQDVFLKVLEVVDAHGAQCAFPTSTIHAPGIEAKNWMLKEQPLIEGDTQ